MTLVNSTVRGNSTSSAGAGIFTFGSGAGVGTGAVMLSSTIVANSGGAADLAAVNDGSFSGSFNLIEDASESLLSGNDNITGDPLLGPLADNGGPTQTHALLPDSPAIDAGSSVETFDQRGFARAALGAVDIGAFEAQETPSLVVTTTDDVIDETDQQTSLREAIAFANTLTGADTIAFEPSVFTGGDDSLIRLNGTELEITDTLTIDGSTATDVTITGDANDDDITDGANIIDVAASGPSLLTDNSRVLNFSSTSGDLTLLGLTITGGRTTGDDAIFLDEFYSGGGVRFLSAGTLALTSSAVTGNSTAGAFARGGGIYTSSGAVTLTSSTLTDNSTAGSAARGGGIYTNSGAVTLTSSTVSGNSTAGVGADGGGINSGGVLEIISSTVVNNTAAGIGGGVYQYNRSITIENSILAGNTDSGTAPDLEDNGNTLTISSSLIGDNTGSGLAPSSTADANGNLIGALGSVIDPLLGVLADNGGPTLTHALLPGSPAIDAGSSAETFDQRGFARAALGGVDIGAVEAQELPGLIVTTASDIDDETDQLTSLREAIFLANSKPGADTITFDPNVFTGGDDSLIRLNGTELEITDTLTIDGSTATDVTITGDANDDDITDGANITDVAASGPSLLADNSRVLNFSSFSGDLTLNSLTLTGGRTTGDNLNLAEFPYSGGGVRFLSAGTLALTNSTVTGNSTAGDFARGGGIYTSSGAVTLTSSTVSGNNTAGFAARGGGIYTNSGAVTLTSSTVSGNSTARYGADGGGIYVDDSTVLIESSTITGNVASRIGGGIGILTDDFIDSARLTIRNSIVAGNSDIGTAPDVQAVGDPANDQIVEFSLIGDTTGSGVTSAAGTGNLLNTNPLLGVLADNGGPTFTHALLAGSPAINAGSSTETFDQRGFARPALGAVDIGAFELQPVIPSQGLIVSSNSDVVDGDFAVGELSLREAIFIANAAAGADTITFDSDVFTGDGNSLIRLTSGELEITDTLTIDASALTDNVTIDAQQNSRVLNFSAVSGDLTLNELTITGGRTTGFGAGGGGILFSSEGALALTGSTLSGNSTAGDNANGGGISTSSGAVTLTSSTLTANSTAGFAAYGGGIYTQGGAVTLTNSTLSGNSSSAYGGGIFTNFGAVTLSNSTITGNRARLSAGGVFVTDSSYNSPFRIENSIIAGNTDNDTTLDLRPDPGSPLTVNNSLIGVADSGLAEDQQDAISNGVGNQTGTAASPLDPLLGPLANNGGPTQTHALLPGSPAIDAGAANIAPLGMASQSSDLSAELFLASNAIDGIFSNFTHTAGLDANPQFTLTFDTDQLFTEIVLHNRSGFEQRLRDITVEVFDASGTAVFTSTLLNPGNILNGPATIAVTLPVPTQGRTVRVSRTPDPDIPDLNDRNVLSLGEIEVFSTDQRGFARNVNGVDIGAFEAQETPSLVVTTTDDVIDETDQQTSLREAIAFANNLPGADTITFDQGVFGSAQTIAINSQLPTISDDLTITGPGADLLTLDAGGGATAAPGDGFRIFDIDNGDSSDIVDVAISGLTLTGGDASSNGGAIRTAENLTLTSSIVSGNHSGDDGGGIFNVSEATLAVIDSTITGNTSSNNGGGIFSSSGNVELTSSTLIGNSTTGANTDGGGILAIQGDVTLTGSTVSGNTSGDDGGGIAAIFGDVELTGSTVSGNSGGGDGGGIYSFSGTVKLSSSTITDNTAGRMGGGVSINGNGPDESQTVILSNTILAGNNVAGAPDDLSLNPDRVLSVGFSLIGVADSGLTALQQDAISNGADNQTGTASAPLDPLLGPLANNGGPTQTHALLPGSPALDAGAATIAPLGTASQSTEELNFGGPFPAERAVDGDFGNFTHTASTGDENPSFTLDFDTDQFITQIVLHNRGDGFVPERLRDITVAVLDANGTAVFTSELLNPNNVLNGPATITVTLPTVVQGRTVQVSRTGAVLSLGEIEVFSTDQRGFARNVNGVDIGAFEAQETPSLVVTTTDDVIDETDQQTSLREAIAFANTLTGADTIAFDTNVFTGGTNNLIRLTSGELRAAGTLTIDASALTDNVTIDAQQSSRVLNFISASGDLTLDSLIITGGRTTGNNVNFNDSTNSGGGIRFLSAGTLALTSSTVSSNRTAGNLARGGGIFTNSGSVTLTSSTLSGNSTAGFLADGGGISTSSGAVTLISSTLTGNSTTGFAARGGGIYTPSGAVTLTDSTLSGNSTAGESGEGGGIRTVDGAVALTNSTLSGNSTAGVYSEGGGIFSYSGTVTLTSSTLTGNRATSSEGGGVFVDNTSDYSPAFLIENSIIAGNTDDGTAPDLRPDFDSTLDINFSLIGVADFGLTPTQQDAISNGEGNQAGTAASPLDPLLAPLADNGGPTETHALLPGSPAMDTGDPGFDPNAITPPLVSDQRGSGFDRVFGPTVDIGAFEQQFLFGDFNRDLVVSPADFVIFRDTLGASVPTSTGADGDGDGVVTAADFNVFVGNFGATATPPASPATAADPSEAVLGTAPIDARAVPVFTQPTGTPTLSAGVAESSAETPAVAVDDDDLLLTLALSSALEFDDPGESAHNASAFDVSAFDEAFASEEDEADAALDLTLSSL